MKGVVLAGGLGTRLYPLTKITNKHLLPVYDLPMVYYPIMTLREAGIDEILMVTGGNSVGEFLRLMGDGTKFGLRGLHYTYQEREGGIADAIYLARKFVGDDSFCVILGDNILDGSIRECISNFVDGAMIFIKEVDDPREYGVAILDGKKVKGIVEKPEKPPSNYAVIGAYVYTGEVFDIIRKLKPSERGELEVTDVNNEYIKQGRLTYEIFEGYWGDAGASVDALLDVNNYVARRKKEDPNLWRICPNVNIP
ncbi:spore coat protein [candidate division WOR-3 bacterium JGI_Cruoil_03_44_89]|uniref:glucose-1-phosphate thymidylyltransferase n=1 Tax=candidate division WOR-3 bacterium JGI_Cruoil_03_44_89 TaxID=1973748 RepID=A0A235BNP3_UNCW3|nr:MAG: spore coat protein [candidate division WOR-3 bacterium JGI_Cruoil_03_44_89]